MILPPFPHHIKVPANVLSVEVWESLWVVLVPPDLTEQANVNSAHQLLSKDVQTVSWAMLAICHVGQTKETGPALNEPSGRWYGFQNDTVPRAAHGWILLI